MTTSQTASRKLNYKLPPTVIRDQLVSQEARRNKALEDQKRRRALRVDSARQLDIFSTLTLGDSDDDHDDPDTQSVNVASVAPYASMLRSDITPNAITEPGISLSSQPTAQPAAAAVPNKPKKRNKRRSNKPSKWADQCMYAELLEMSSDDPWVGRDGTVNDGLPTDLETAWVAVAPVPAGKRCLAVTHQSSVPNTTLRSRLLGKTLITRFPSSLPPLTVLDCILDVNWKDNGILHILDVIKWKGQDVGDCEAPFRFWWRDTRLKELEQAHPPLSNLNKSFVPSPHLPGRMKYQFAYPITLVPIPYHTDTSLPTLLTDIIPSTRKQRMITVNVPCLSNRVDRSETMDIEDGSSAMPAAFFTFQPPTGSPHADPAVSVTISPRSTMVDPDGLLLYVAQASFEPGTSPLSSWIPLSNYEDEAGTEGTGHHRHSLQTDGPVSLFENLVKRRLQWKSHQAATCMQTSVPEVEMSM